MSTITITLPEDHLARLNELATQLGIAPEDLARAGVEDMLVRPHETFQQVLDHVLSTNAELYRRLATL